MFDGTLAGIDNIEETWYVPYKFYSCTNIIMSYGSSDLSGLQLTFSPRVDGFPTITKTFGNMYQSGMYSVSMTSWGNTLSLIVDSSEGRMDFSGFFLYSFGSLSEETFSYDLSQESLLGFKVIIGPNSDDILTIRQAAPITADSGCQSAGLTIMLPQIMTYIIGQADPTIETHTLLAMNEFNDRCAYSVISDTPSILTTATDLDTYELSLDASSYAEVAELTIILTVSIIEFPDILTWVYDIPVQIVQPLSEPATCPEISCTPETLERTVPNVLQNSESMYFFENRLIKWYVPYQKYQMTRLSIWRFQLSQIAVVTGFEVQFDPPDDYSGWPSIVHLFGEKNESSGYSTIDAEFTQDISKIDLVEDFLGSTPYSSQRTFGGFQFDGLQQDLEVAISDSYEQEEEYNGYDLLTIELPNRLIGFQVLVGPQDAYSSTIRQVAPIVESSVEWTCKLATPKVVIPQVITYIIGQGTPTTGSYYLAMTDPWGKDCSFTVTSENPDLLTATVNSDATAMELSFETDNPSLAGSLEVQLTFELADFQVDPWVYTIPIDILTSDTSMVCPALSGCSPMTLPATTPEVLEMTVGDILEGLNSQIDFIVPFKFYRVTKFEAWNDANQECMGIEVTFEPPSRFTGWEPIIQLFGTKPDDSMTDTESMTLDVTYGIAQMLAAWNLIGPAKELDSIWIREFRHDSVTFIPNPNYVGAQGVAYQVIDYQMNNRRLVGFRAITGLNYDGTMTTIRQIAPIVENEGCEAVIPTIVIPDTLFYTIGQDAPSTSEHYIEMATVSENCEFTMTTSEAYLTVTTDAFDIAVGVKSYQFSLETTQSSLVGDHTVELTLTVVGFEDYIWFKYNIPVTIYVTDPYPNACSASGCDPATLEKTVPELQTMTTGDVWDESTDFIWHVPYKYYRLTTIKTWQDVVNNKFSGFEVTYEPPSGFIGWLPFTQMFGTTEFGASDEISVDYEIQTMTLAPMKNAKSVGFGGFILSAWNTILSSGASECIDTVDDCTFLESQPSQCPFHSNSGCCICDGGDSGRTYTFNNQRLIGFKAIIGPEKDRSANTIRRISPIFDTVGCETAGSKWSIFEQPLIMYSLITSQVTHTGNLELRVQKPWYDDPIDLTSNDCGYTLSTEEPSLTLTMVTDQEYSFVYEPDPASIPVDSNYYSFSVRVTLTIEPLIEWTHTMNVLIVEYDPFEAPPTSARYCSSGSEPWESTPPFNICYVANSLGFTCPPIDAGKVLCLIKNVKDTDWALHRITTTDIEKVTDTENVYDAETESYIDILTWSSDQNWEKYGSRVAGSWSMFTNLFFMFAETDLGECTNAALPSSYQFEINFIDDCTDYSLEKLPPLDTVLHTVPETGSFKTGNLGAEFVEDDWSIGLKNYVLSRIRIWKDDYTISGFEVTFEAELGSQGYEPIKHMYGSPSIISRQGYEAENLLVDLSDNVTNLSIMMDDTDSDPDLIAFKTGSYANREIIMVAEGKIDSGSWENFEINTRLIGFHVKIGKADGSSVDEIDTIRSIALIYDMTRCETAVFTLLGIQSTPFILGSDANTNDIEVKLLTEFDENCVSHLPDTITIINFEDPSDTSVTAAFGSLVLLDTQALFKTYTFTVNTASDSSLGTHQLAIQFEVEIYAGIPPIQFTSDQFQVEVLCDETDADNYPMTADGTYCPGQFSFCPQNYRMDGDGVGCTSFDNCNETGEGTGDTDLFNNMCPADYIDTSCADGWQYNLNYEECPGYTAASSSSGLEPCQILGETFVSDGLLCPTQYYGACVGQQIEIPFGWYANQFYSDFLLTSLTSDYFIRLQTGPLFGNIGIKSMSEFIEYGDPYFTKNGQSGSSRSMWPGSDAAFGYFKFTVEAGHIGTTIVTFTKCQDAAWDTSTQSNDESTQCEAETFSIEIKITDACTGLNLDWLGQVKYPLDKSMMAQWYNVDIKHLFSSLSPLQVSPSLRIFMEGNVPTENLDQELGYSRGANRFEARFDEYTDTLGNSEKQDQPLSAFAALEFDQEAFTHITDSTFIINEGGKVKLNFMYEEMTNEQAIIPTGYYKATISLISYIYKDRSTINNPNSIEVFKQSIYFYVCEDCDTWTLEIQEDVVPDPVEPDPEPEIIDPDVLFEDAKVEFEREFPFIQFMMAGEELTIEVTMITNPDYSETMTLEENLGTAQQFTEFDAESGKIIISPGESKVGTYQLKMTLTDGSNIHMKTMNLQVIKPVSVEEADPESEEEYELDLGILLSREYFMQADPSYLTVNVGEPLVFDAMNYITKDIGTIFNKIELLQLFPFTQCSGARMVISPVSTNQAGQYPFIVRVIDDQNRPQNKQYQIIVVDPTKNLSVEEDVQVYETEIEAIGDNEYTADEDPSGFQCNEQCRQDAAGAELEEILANAVTETTVQVAGLEISFPLDELSGGRDERGSAIGDIMDSVADLPVSVQEAVFDIILKEKQKYQDQQRQIATLTALSQGWTPPEPVPPAVAFENVEPTGTFGLYFNSGVSGLQFLDNLNKGLSSRGEVDDNGMGRRLSDHVRGGQRRLEGNEDFNLSNYLVFSIKRGSEDAAEVEDLGFTVQTVGLENRLLNFVLRFDNPIAVSMGSEKDMMVATIVDGQFFSSDDNGLPIEPGTTIQQLLPKMLASEEIAEAMEATKDAVESTEFVMAQIGITLVLAVSLKSMWNLMNVIQVLAYVRFFTGWPAFMLEIFKFMDNAITMKPLSDPIFEYGQSQFQKANATLSDEGMKNMGVQDTQLMKSLGLFAVTFIGLLVLVLVYKAAQLSKKKTGLMRRLKIKLKKKLFYSSFLRYMIVSNLKLNFTIWAFLVSQGSFETIIKGATTVIYLLILFGICIYPVFIMKWLVQNQSLLWKEEVRQKWETLYQGIHTHRLDALIYNVVFSVRRFNIVLINMFFSPGFPLSNFKQNQYLFKSFAFIFVQTSYGLYVWYAKPHTNNVFNQLEFFNEGMIIIMCYIMVVYTGIGETKYIIESQTPVFLSLAVTVAIIIANFGVMISMLIVKFKQKVAAKLEMKRLQALNKNRKNYKAKDLIKPGLADSLWRSELKSPGTPMALIEEEKEQDEHNDVHITSYNEDVQQKVVDDLNNIYSPNFGEAEQTKNVKKFNRKKTMKAKAKHRREIAGGKASMEPEDDLTPQQRKNRKKLFDSMSHQQVQSQSIGRKEATKQSLERAQVVIAFKPDKEESDEEESAYLPLQNNDSTFNIKPDLNDVMTSTQNSSVKGKYSEWNKHEWNKQMSNIEMMQM